jgi:hypothetical protein
MTTKTDRMLNRPNKVSLTSAREHMHRTQINDGGAMHHHHSLKTQVTGGGSEHRHNNWRREQVAQAPSQEVSNHANNYTKQHNPAGQVWPGKCKRPKLFTESIARITQPANKPTMSMKATHVPPEKLDTNMTGMQLRWQPEEANLHMSQIVEGIQNDDTRWKINPPDPTLMQQLMLQITQASSMAAAVRTTKQDKSIWVQKWMPFCKEMGTPTWRNDMRIHTDHTVRQREGYLLCFFYLYCLNKIRPKDRSKSMCKPQTPAAYVRAITRTHKRYGVTMVETSFIKVIMQGMCNLYVARHGPEAFMPHRKEPLSVQIIQDMLNVPDGTNLGKLGVVERGSLLWDSLCAGFEVAAQTGSRAAEIGTDKKTLTIADYTFDHAKWSVNACSKTLMEEAPIGVEKVISPSDYLSLRPTISKADQRGETWVPFPIYLHYRKLAAINAARAVLKLEVDHGVALNKRTTTPLFRDNAGLPLTINDFRTAFTWLIKAVLPATEWNKYSFHSFRIWLATALADCGAESLLIQFLVRWQTEESLRTYCRMTPRRQARWLDATLTAHVDSTTAQELQQRVEIDNHSAVQTAMQWTTTPEPAEPPEAPEEMTETVETSLPPLPVPSFTWQSCAQPTGNRPHGVLYETLANSEQDMTPSREWSYCMPAPRRSTTHWEFVIGKSQGLQPRTKVPWGPPTAELVDITQHLKCVNCGQHPHVASRCQHKRISLDPANAPVQQHSSAAMLQQHT